MKSIIIAGANSYIGKSFMEYVTQWEDQYKVEELETKGLKPMPEFFKKYDVVFCVTGIAHIKETTENRHLYYDVNRELVIAIAKAAKEAGVKQFILLSSMSVYGLEAGHITKSTEPHPVNAYGESKLQADRVIKTLEDESFIFTCLRPPMVYGEKCPGNYQKLRKLALKTHIFPEYQNQRSMIYIFNLCEFVKGVIDEEKGGLFFPQNTEYVNTSVMVKQIADANGQRMLLTKAFNWVVRIVPLNLKEKVFGDLTYEKVDLVCKYSFEESIKRTEGTYYG